MSEILLDCAEPPSFHAYQLYLAECTYLLGWQGRLMQLHNELLEFAQANGRSASHPKNLGRQERLGACLELLKQLDDCLLTQALHPLEQRIEHFEESELRREQNYLRQTLGQQWV